jgi:hypothetical protein
MSAVDLTDARLANQIAVAIYDRLAEEDRVEPYIEPYPDLSAMQLGWRDHLPELGHRHDTVLHGPELHVLPLRPPTVAELLRHPPEEA